MVKIVRPDEMRIVIRHSNAPAEDPRPIPADVFRKTFNTVLAALKAADKAERVANGRKGKGQFYVSHLQMGSNEFGVSGRESVVELFRQCATEVYRSDYSRVVAYPALAKKIAALGSTIDKQFAVIAQFDDGELPIDGFFSKQAERLKETLSPGRHLRQFFAGSAIGSFDGRLGNIDYRGAVWNGHLLLHGSDVQIECVFDKSQGEDAFNPYGNKRVTITGRAIYTGDSALPERIEVVTIDAVPHATRSEDIRGTLKGRDYSGWDDELENFH